MSAQLVTVFGGSGFIGRYVVERLAHLGYRVRVAVRRPNEALFLKPLGLVGQIQLVAAHLAQASSVDAALAGADHAVNLVGTMKDHGSQNFTALHETGPAYLGQVCAKMGLQSLVHISAMGAALDSRAHYSCSKAKGEALLLDAFPQAIILRPNLVIGLEDQFFNRFAKMAQHMPVLALPGLDTKFQPLCVGDLADAIVKAVTNFEDFAGQTFDLSGPKIYSLRALLELMMAETQTHRPLIALPDFAARFLAGMTAMLPNPPISFDQLELLKHDLVHKEGQASFESFQLTAHAIEGLLPRYMVQYRPQGQFSKAA